MFRSRVPIIVFVSLVVAALPLVSHAQGGNAGGDGFRPDAPPYGIRGPHPVGTMAFTIEDETRPINGRMWYPAFNPDLAEELTTYEMGIEAMPALNLVEGHALENATPDLNQGPYPLVVYSHGLGASMFTQPYLLEHLASYGFVVLAIRHPGNELVDNMAADTPEEQAQFADTVFTSIVTRPRDISATIDYAEMLTQNGDMAGLIDTDQIAVTGHSYGGYTAIVTAGGRFDFSLIDPYCAAGDFAGLLATVCPMKAGGGFAEQEQRLMDLAGIDAEPGLPWPESVSDPRIDAVVAFDPGGILPAVGTLDSITVPLMMMPALGSDVHTIGLHVFDEVGSPVKVLAALENANHYVFGNCNNSWRSVAFEVCSDPVWDMDRAHDLIDHFVTAFLLYELKGNEDAHAALLPEAGSFPGITYEAQGL